MLSLGRRRSAVQSCPARALGPSCRCRLLQAQAESSVFCVLLLLCTAASVYWCCGHTRKRLRLQRFQHTQVEILNEQLREGCYQKMLNLGQTGSRNSCMYQKYGSPCNLNPVLPSWPGPGFLLHVSEMEPHRFIAHVGRTAFPVRILGGPLSMQGQGQTVLRALWAR